MMRTILYPFLILTLLSCSKPDADSEVNQEIDSFTFGETEYPPFISSCAYCMSSEFDIKEGTLFEIKWPEGVRAERKLEDSKTKLANSLKNTPIPDYLWNGDRIQMLGCVDCAQTSMVYLYVRKGELAYQWYFNRNIDQIPSQIKVYVKKLIETIDAIK